MAAEIIGKVKSPNNNKIYRVKWNSTSKEAYVEYAGWTKIDNAKNVEQALNFALSWLIRHT